MRAAPARKSLRASRAKPPPRGKPMSDHWPSDTPRDPAIEAITRELEAMQVIAEALAGLGDLETRQRVLQWANERFNATCALAGPARRAEMPPQADTALSVETLYELFEAPRAVSAAARTRIAAESPVPNTAPVRTTIIEISAAPVVAEPRTAREEPALDTVVRGIASDLKRLAVEWQTA
jgi:hypothetical protein